MVGWVDTFKGVRVTRQAENVTMCECVCALVLCVCACACVCVCVCVCTCVYVRVHHCMGAHMQVNTCMHA